MNKHKLSHAELLARWVEAEILLRGVDFDSAITEAKVESTLRRLTKRMPSETLEAWLIRSRSSTCRTHAVIIPFPNTRFVPLTEFLRRAASSNTESYPLPDNGSLESVDGRFRLTVIKGNETLHIKIEALGMAADEFSDCYVGLSSKNGLDDLCATIYMNNDGDGECVVPDTEEIRRVLLRPVIGAIRRA